MKPPGASPSDRVDRPPTRAWPRRLGSVPQQWSRQRCWYFGLIALLYLLAFNPHWHLGPDSALYRSLGRSLAEGGGYVYHGEPHGHAYPGLPYLLAAARKLFGQDVVPLILLNLTLVAVSLVLVYHTVRLLYPRWIASAAAIMTGSSVLVLQKTYEVLTDLPFFFAVCLVLFAHGKLRGTSGRVAPGWLALVGLGLALAALMRPAFWIVLAALVLTEVWEAFRGSWKRSAWTAAAIMVAGAAWVLLDPRHGGRDEAKVMKLLSRPERMLDRMAENLPDLFNQHLTEAMVGFRFGPGLDVVFTLLVIVGSIGLVRRSVLMGSLVACTLGVTVLFAGSLPRYYLMIYPLLALGWIEALRHVTHRLPAWWRNQAMGLGIGLIVLGNLVNCGIFAWRQHERPFLAHFEKGQWQPILAMAEAIRQHVPPGARVVGPDARVLTFETRRDVIDPALVLRRTEPSQWLAELCRRGVEYAILPAGSYEDNDPPLLAVLLPLEAQLPPTDDPAPRWTLVRWTCDPEVDQPRLEAVLAHGPWPSGER